jgi:hypothetical protein
MAQWSFHAGVRICIGHGPDAPSRYSRDLGITERSVLASQLSSRARLYVIKDKDGRPIATALGSVPDVELNKRTDRKCPHVTGKSQALAGTEVLP